MGSRRGIGIVSESVLTILLLMVAGLLIIDITLQVACCLHSRQTSQVVTGQVIISGSGSTFVYPQMKEWTSKFSQKHPGVSVLYNPVGSGSGQTQFLKERVVDFACSDPPLSEEQYQEFRGRVLQMPIIIGAVAVVYKIPGYTGPLNLTGEVLALIYRGDIAYWDDPSIRSLNPAASLPHAEIKVLHRSDSSGTTQVFTYFLHKTAPNIWPEALVGKTLEWPIDATGRGLGGKGNEGVAGYFKQLDSAIAYLELGYAVENNFSIAAIMNREGKFVLPDKATMQAAIKGALEAGLLPDSPLDDWSNALDAIVYAPGDMSYPIVSFTFMITWTEYPSVKTDALKAFIKYINTEGQEEIIEGYSPIPVELRQINLKSLNIIRGAGG